MLHLGSPKRTRFIFCRISIQMWFLCHWHFTRFCLMFFVLLCWLGINDRLHSWCCWSWTMACRGLCWLLAVSVCCCVMIIREIYTISLMFFVIKNLKMNRNHYASRIVHLGGSSIVFTLAQLSIFMISSCKDGILVR